MLRPLLRSLSAPLLSSLLAAPSAAQLPDGHVLVTFAGSAAQPRPGLAYLEPLRGRITPIGNVGNQPWTLHRAALAGSSDLALLGIVGGDGTPAILRAGLAGDQLTGGTVFATGLRGAPTGMLRLADGRVLICTTHSIYAVGPGGGIATPLINTSTALGCVDLTAAPGKVVVLAVVNGGVTPATILYEIDSGSLQITPRPISLATEARSLAVAPALGGYLLGDALGTLHLVDQRWVTSVWLQTPLGPISSLVYDSDQKNHLLGGNGAAHVLTGTQIGATFGFGSAGALTDLDYAPYRSTFSSYGVGCPGSSGLAPQLDGLGRPFPGNPSFAIRLSQAAPNSRATLFAGFQQLAFDLGFLGMARCVLLLQPTIERSAATGNGSTLLPFPIPPLATLVGHSLYFQGFVIDPGSNTLGVVASNGGRADF